MTLGYGTAALGRTLSARERLRLVEAAFDAGISYFDTAPLYGAGAAEEALGKIEADITVATKVGIVPPPLARLALGRALGRPARAAANRFDPADVRRQLEGSLSRLRRDRVEVLLLHEVTALGPALIETVEALREEGKVGRWGIATAAAATREILAQHVPDVVQVAAADAVDARGAQLVLHSILAGRVGGADAASLLRTVAAAQPGAVILVGSRREDHIRQAAAALS
jgi:aryl-alcohol dehydrogenase-like predicted oxidoreductase